MICAAPLGAPILIPAKSKLHYGGALTDNAIDPSIRLKRVDAAFAMIPRSCRGGRARALAAEFENIKAQNRRAHGVMHNAGIIEYKSNIDAAPLIAKLDLAPYLEAGIAEIRRQFYGEGTHVSNNGRHAGRRHPGEAGATFALSDAAAAERGRARSGDP